MKLYDYEKKHIEMLRPYLPECTVLLKSDGGFPLSAPGKIALYGSGVRKTLRGGTGSGEVNSRYFDTVEAGFEAAGFTVTSKQWLDGYERTVEESFEAFKKALQAKAKEQHKNVMVMAMGATMPEPDYELPLNAEGDTAIYVLSRISGEGTDRKPEKGDILLSDTEQRDILALNKNYKNFMLVLNTGGVVDLSPVIDVKNILILSQLGVETGSALARIVLGQQYPSGKLTTTWCAWKDYPDLDYGGYDETRYKEGIYVGYRYFDTLGGRVLFPFGFGLGYTEFAVSEEKTVVDRTRVKVSANVRNTGARPGREVVQVYVNVPSGKLDQPYQTLAAWVKTPELSAGESRTVEASFDLTEIASYDTETACWILEQGEYIIRVGSHSRNTRPVAVLQLKETVRIKQVKNALGKPDFQDLVPDGKSGPGGMSDERTDNTGAADIPILEIDAGAFRTETVSYDAEYPIDPKAGKLSDEDLALLSNGSFGKGGMMSIIGNASTSVSGAAGESAHVAGFRPIIMADGPAGLRINQRYYVDKKGRKKSLEAPFPQSLIPFMSAPMKSFMDHFMVKEPKDKSRIKYQYCTAMPIGTALAQSWNLELAEVCGDIAGAEMDRFGVDLWLAPALNIHRSIQCGRDFEYYSEDPLISGRFAAAITKGVQRHPGRGVTIKHYAANNQEFNRTSSNSMVSERAMREIYLRGFGICVKESAPLAVMTSYNLINGQHTSTRRDMIEDILRCEFGFTGLVMTDWVIQGGMIPKDAKYPGPNAADVAAAGGDLFMPGSQNDYENVLTALKEGKLSKKQLQVNATRILKFWGR